MSSSPATSTPGSDIGMRPLSGEPVWQGPVLRGQSSRIAWQSTAARQHGKALLQFCLNTDLLFCSGSVSVPPTCTAYSIPDGGSVIDHILCSRSDTSYGTPRQSITLHCQSHSKELYCIVSDHVPVLLRCPTRCSPDHMRRHRIRRQRRQRLERQRFQEEVRSRES